MSCVGSVGLTFILSMLASIFSCSTSFLACAMLAVLLLAIGVPGGFFRHPEKDNEEEECVRDFRSCQVHKFIRTEGSQKSGWSQAWLVQSSSSSVQLCLRLSGGPEYGVCFSNSPDLLPLFRGKKNEVCYQVGPNQMCCHINKASY